jgi:hypothetical protein
LLNADSGDQVANTAGLSYRVTLGDSEPFIGLHQFFGTDGDDVIGVSFVAGVRRLFSKT